MRLLFLIITLAAFAACKTSGHLTVSSNGTWIPEKEEINGTALAAAVFEKQKLVLQDSLYAFYAESVDRGVVHSSGEHMDIYGREGVNAGRHFMAIFKLEGDRLTICYNLGGNGYPEAFDTKGKPKYFLCVFRKS